MTPKQFQQLLAQHQIEVKRAMNEDIPKIVANKAVSMFKKNFREEGFFGTKWKDVKRRTNPPKNSRHPADALRRILTGRSANLGRSIRFRVDTGKAIIYSDLPYSSAHNDGTNNAGRNRNVHIPKRQFLGDHEQIRDMVQTTINQQLKSIFKR